jgi:hypothetical protein
VSNRVISKNINTALEVLSSCQYVLGLVAKVKDYVEQKRFYPAIKVPLPLPYLGLTLPFLDFELTI